ncbi:SET domain-containing protein 9 isoform X2 [Dromiciops gliroides]|uniref:SET domain-containing protein 9 isoform X2 n=1 Tax=Dromiciops gliroides TaxID=33562 RepID=UPI001CC81C5F|nr:SET domain-containing protein 9 isoform X2 [Dromiciops gliroides]
MLFRTLLRVLRQRWHRYKYRFVPWIALNLSQNRRTLRYVPEHSKDKIIPDEDVLGTLLKVFQALFIRDFGRQTDILALLPEAVKSKYQDLLVTHHQRTEQPRCNVQQQKIYKPGEVLFNTLGFSISRETSSLISAGKGVFVTRGFVPKGAVVSMYPGTVYQKHEPIFFQSIGNPFIFRCLDGMLIDGNDKGISKVVYRSCNGRDQFGPFKMSDCTWLTSEVQNPLAVGQYVNNCSNARCDAWSLWHSGTSSQEKSFSPTTTQLSTDLTVSVYLLNYSFGLRDLFSVNFSGLPVVEICLPFEI